jgi:hypothetical protein
MHYATKMKKLMMVIVLGLSIGCAGTSNLVPSKIGVTRDSFMERAHGKVPVLLQRTSALPVY